MKNKILLIEDARIIQVLIETLLSESGYEIVVCDNGEQALSILKSERFDLLILDLMMPIMDGFTFLHKIKEETTPPILIITARTDYESIEKAMKLGATDYIIKPFNSMDIINKVERILKGKSL